MTYQESRQYLALLNDMSVCRAFTIHAKGGCEWTDVHGVDHHADSIEELRSQIASLVSSNQED